MREDDKKKKAATGLGGGGDKGEGAQRKGRREPELDEGKAALAFNKGLHTGVMSRRTASQTRIPVMSQMTTMLATAPSTSARWKPKLYSEFASRLESISAITLTRNLSVEPARG